MVKSFKVELCEKNEMHPPALLTIKTKRYKFTKYFEYKLTVIKTI